MTEEQRKILTEYLGECFHQFKLPNPLGGNTCLHCQNKVSDIHSWRTFTTPDDMDALRRKLVEKGDWSRFISCSIGTWEHENHYVDIDIEEITNWLMDPTRFCELVAGYLESKDSNSNGK